jgi:hypothetical protein
MLLPGAPGQTSLAFSLLQRMETAGNNLFRRSDLFRPLRREGEKCGEGAGGEEARGVVFRCSDL